MTRNNLFITRILSWLVSAALTLVFVLFVLSNRDVVTLSFWPFATTITAPLYLFFLVTLLLAFMAGLGVMWVRQHKYRAAAHRLQKKLDEIEAAQQPPAADTAALIAPSIY